jgi:hypothetical protein
MNCGGDDNSPDFYGIKFDFRGTHFPNRGFQCVNSLTEYDQLIAGFQNYQIPVVLSYGCEANKSHAYNEVEYIYGSPMNSIFSGAIAHGWFDGAHNTSERGKSDPPTQAVF